MNICVVGTGYVGLVTGAVFADLGNDVVCVDNDVLKIADLEIGRMPIYEPGLEGSDLGSVVVDADDVVTEIREDGARDEAHVTRSDHTDVHGGGRS